MLTRKVFSAGLCMAALGWSAAHLYGEVTLPPGALAECADGSCVPRRVTNGYFPTKWRPWPVKPPATPAPGVAPGIPAPPVELPTPAEETRRPSGGIIAPRPQPAPSTSPDATNDDVPDFGPAAPPPDGGAPPADPRDDLPPALRNQIPATGRNGLSSTLPPDPRSPRRIPNVALRRTRPATVVEALREETTWQPTRDPQHTREPGMLPSDGLHRAEPIRQAPAEMAPGASGDVPQANNAQRPGFDRDAFAYSNTRVDWLERSIDLRSGPSMAAANPADGDGRENAAVASLVPAPEREPDSVQSAPVVDSRLGARLSALRHTTVADEPASRWVAPRTASPQVIEPAREKSESASPQATLRLSPYGMNTPAVVGIRPGTERGQNMSGGLDRSNGAARSGAHLAVRTVGDDWSDSTSAGNPLRRNSRITRVAFENHLSASAEPSADQAEDRPAGDVSHDANFAVPANPLR